MKKGQTPLWKQKLDEKIRKSNEMARLFRKMGIECTVDEYGDVCIEGSEFQKVLDKPGGKTPEEAIDVWNHREEAQHANPAITPATVPGE